MTKPMDPTKRAFTTGEVARLCSVTAPTVIRWVREGRLDAHRIGDKGGRRIPRQSLIEFAQRHSIALGPVFDTGLKRILVVSQDSEESQTLRALFPSKDGFETQVATGLFEAGFMAMKLKPHAMFLDLAMPGVDGLHVCRRLRSENDLSHCKIIVLSPLESAEVVETMLSAGADAYLAKPLRPETAVQRVQELLLLRGDGRTSAGKRHTP